ncbi:hypothetical protein AB0M95_40840 [Sphaerisporangium sp. NPDC051017]
MSANETVEAIRESSVKNLVEGEEAQTPEVFRLDLAEVQCLGGPKQQG